MARHLSLAAIPVWLALAWALVADTVASDSLTAVHMAHYPAPTAWVWIVAGLVGTALIVAMLACLWPIWRHGRWPLLLRAACSAYVLLGLLWIGLLQHWNLLGLRVLG